MENTITRPRVLIITHDVVEARMAGPAIRCWEFAQVLAKETTVTLATPYPTSLTPDNFKLVTYDADRLQELAMASEVIILSGVTLWRFPFLKTLKIPLVADLYDPFLLESLPMLAMQPPLERERRHLEVLDALTDLLTWGDFFICASEKQRDYWLGWLNALNRINPTTYDDDASLRRLLDVVAFGLPDTPPQSTQQVLKGVHPHIAETDKVIIWGGGVYNWFDPLTLIKAMANISRERNDVKLFFLGVRHPNPDVGGDEMVNQAMALSQQLNLTDQCVFFNDWVSYRKRHHYLLEADVGVSLHFAHIETLFSFRTRLLDYLWTGLPMIVTRGDTLSDLVEQNQLGWVVDYENVDDVTAAIQDSLTLPRDQFHDRFVEVAQQFTWQTVLQPLVTFCRQPHLAPDRQASDHDIQALPALKLFSHLKAVQRDLMTSYAQVASLDSLLREREATIANFERVILTNNFEINNLRQHIQALETALNDKDTIIRDRDTIRDTIIRERDTIIHERDATIHDREATIRAREAEIQRLQNLVTQIRQGRVMRLLDGVTHIIKGNPV